MVVALRGLPAICALLLLATAVLSADAALPFEVRSSFGPYLRYSRLTSNDYQFSVLVGYKGGSGLSSQLQLSFPGAPSSSSAGGHVNWQTKELLTSYGGYTFVRWRVSIRQGSTQVGVRYRVSSKDPSKLALRPEVTQEYKFYIAGAAQEWHWSFYSCNGYIGNVPPQGFFTMWNDLVASHSTKALHLVVGGGDQLYNDGALEAHPDLKKVTTDAKYASDAIAFRWTDYLKGVVNNWYFSHYVNHFSVINPSYRKALATIPFVMMWDDHDAFNSYNSQAPQILSSELYKGYSSIARTWYLLFQHHSTPSKMMPDLISGGAGGLHWLGRLGPTTALLVTDLRSERTQTRVMAPPSYTNIFNKLNTLPSSIKHLVVVTTAPIAFPGSEYANDILKIAGKPFGIGTWAELQATYDSRFKRTLIDAVTKTALGFTLADKLKMSFGMLEVGDLIDQWEGKEHGAERAAYINRLTAWSTPRKVRITFVSGDTHMAYANAFYSSNPLIADKNKDPRYMVQVVSSAIGNYPAGNGLAKFSEATSLPLAYNPPLDDSEKVRCRELAVWTLMKGLAPTSVYFAQTQNWLEVNPSSSGGQLKFTWHLKSVSTSTAPVVYKDIYVPRYNP